MRPLQASRLVGFDDLGEVFDCGDVVLRKVADAYKPEVENLYGLYRVLGLVDKGVVDTTMRADGDLEHRKLVISYPFEWPANMFKDAVVFHLDLLANLDSDGLTLKDALPNNILFEHTRPVFVDFLSLVRTEKLADQRWLEPQKYVDPRFAVIERMLLPYMVLPLVFMARREYGTARNLLSRRSCNCDGPPPSWRELLPLNRRPGKRWIPEYLFSLALAARFFPLRRFATRKAKREYGSALRTVAQAVGQLDVTPRPSAYSSYYDEKKEAQSLVDPSSFLPKQRAIQEILLEKRPLSLLDIGANTGWYARLAANNQASVIALEQDESCIDILYQAAKAGAVNILPLQLSFADLEKEIYGAEAMERRTQQHELRRMPLYRAATERLVSDMVLVLGLIHHLVLGEGRTLSDVMAVLTKLTRKTLVVEYVDWNDEKILTEPSFFAHLKDKDQQSYSLQQLISIGRRYFSSFVVLDSHPATRKIVVFEK